MSIANCPRCGKIFAKSAGVLICKACIDAEEEDFQKVYAFLKENLEATVTEIQDVTGVAEKLILKFLEDGRLAGTGSKLTPNCQGCGAPIQMGRFCSACLQQKKDQFSLPVSGASQKKPVFGNASAEKAPPSRENGIHHQMRTEKYLKD